MSKHFARPLEQSWPKTLSGFFRAAYTVFTTPPTSEHDVSIYLESSGQLRSKPIKVQPPLNHELKLIFEIINSNPIRPSQIKLSHREITGLMGILMQFCSYIPNLRPYCITPFDDTEKLYLEFKKQGKIAPLDFSQQLNIAVDQTGGDLIEAVWRLFITSRLYARWFDTTAISGLPPFTRKEILNRMTIFSQSVAACKPYGSCPDQDSSGDNYYCWTHALAKLIYKTYAPNGSPIAYLQGLALHNGTKLNHGLAHKYKPQSLPSNHTMAASYGNAIGELLVDHLRNK